MKICMSCFQIKLDEEFPNPNKDECYLCYDIRTGKILDESYYSIETAKKIVKKKDFLLEHNEELSKELYSIKRKLNKKCNIVEKVSRRKRGKYKKKN